MTSPRQYVTKPTFVEAWQIRVDNIKDVAKWCHGRVRGSSVIFPKIRNRGKPLQDTPKDNNHYALLGDYVVRVSNGFVRLSEEEFKSHYAPSGNRIKAS